MKEFRDAHAYAIGIGIVYVVVLHEEEAIENNATCSLT